MISVTMILDVMPNGSREAHRNMTGTPSSTASITFRISNKPKILPASVKFAGI